MPANGLRDLIVDEFFSTVPGKNFDFPLVLRHINPLEILHIE